MRGMRVELEGVTKEFDGVRALDAVSLAVAAGERVALVGPNGSGKSTLLRAVMGMLRCEGTVRLDGQDPFHQRGPVARLAYVPQSAPRLGASVGAVTGAVATLRGLDMAAIRTTADALGLDLETLRHRPVRALSGGTGQKLLNALALAAPVALRIMDEPTASLDHDAREAFFRLFRERANGATLLLSSHRLDEVRRLVERVVVLEAGRVVLDASVSTPEVAARLQAGAWWQGAGAGDAPRRECGGRP